MSKDTVSFELTSHLATMKQAHLADGPASAELRRDRLDRAARLLTAHHGELADAISADYGHRSPYQSLLADVLSSVAALRHAQAHVEAWMQPEEQEAPGPVASP